MKNAVNIGLQLYLKSVFKDPYFIYKQLQIAALQLRLIQDIVKNIHRRLCCSIYLNHGVALIR